MDTGTILLTHKIQLLINSRDLDFRKEVMQKLYHWQHMCFRCANYIFTHQFIQDQLGEMFYISEGLKLKLGDIHKDTDGVLTTSRKNTTYQLLSKHFKGELPSDIYAGLNNTLVQHYNNEREAYWKGTKVLPNYKREMKMPIKGRSIKELQLLESGLDFALTLFKLPFRTWLGRGDDKKREILKNISAGTVTLRDSYIQIKQGRIFLLAVVACKKEPVVFKQGVIAEVSLSVEYPIAVSIGRLKYTIGTKDEFLYRRLAIQAASRRAQQGAGYNHPGHGRKRKFKGVHRFRDTEKNYVDSRLHLYSRRLIDLCVKHGAGTLLLTDQQQKEESTKEDTFLLRNWSYGDLRRKIEYKAARVGLIVIVE